MGIIVKDLLLKGVEGLVEFEPSVTRGEGRYEDVGFGDFDGILLDAGVDGLQDVVGTDAEGADIDFASKGGIGDETEQMVGVLDGDGVDQLVPFALPHFYDGVTRSEQGHAFG